MLKTFCATLLATSLAAATASAHGGSAGGSLGSMPGTNFSDMPPYLTHPVKPADKPVRKHIPKRDVRS